MRFWQSLFVYVWTASLLGTWYELVLSQVMTAVTGDSSWWRPITPATVLHFAEPYGLGAAALILVVVPLRQRYAWRPWLVLVVSGLVGAAVELVSALALVAALGRNPFWDFSSYPFDLYGLTSLVSVLVFGLLATPFVSWVYPATAPVLDRVAPLPMAVACTGMLVLYVAALTVKLSSLG
ncbi:MAG: putative ABC transporter permease [Actinomycetes bacterium]